MFKKILIPLDGSKLAERAIPHAVHMARVFGAQIQLLHVLDSTPYQDSPTVTEPLNWQILKAQAELYLSGIAAQLRDQELTIESQLREGKTAESIINFAQQEGIDLLVISTHGASGLSRWNMSSVAAKVISKACLPILIVRTYLQPAEASEGTVAVELDAYQENQEELAEAAAPAGSSEAGQPAFYRKILLPIDTSRRAECVMPAAVMLAQQGAKTILAAVMQPPSIPVPQPYPDEFQQISNRFVEVSQTAIRMYLDEQSRRIPDVETRVVKNFNVAEAIHEMAEQEDVDLVVLCAHGQTGCTRWPYGSITQNYIDHGVKNVLVVQDVPCSQFRATAAEIAAEKYGRR